VEDKITLTPEELEQIIARATECAIMEVLHKLVLNSAPQHLQSEEEPEEEPQHGPRFVVIDGHEEAQGEEPPPPKKEVPKVSSRDQKAYHRDYYQRNKERMKALRLANPKPKKPKTMAGAEAKDPIVKTPFDPKEYRKRYYRQKKEELRRLKNGEEGLISQTKIEQKIMQAKLEDEEALKKDAALLDSLGVNWRNSSG
jgi:hypothetical protein